MEKAPTNRMKQSKTEEPSVNAWGNAAGGKGGQKERRGNTFPRDKVTTRCRTARFCDQGREKGDENPACEQRPSGKTRDTAGPAANTPGTLNCSGREAGPPSLSLWHRPV